MGSGDPRPRPRPNVWIAEPFRFREGATMEAFTMEYGGIGWAVAHMRKGWRVRRKGWNASNLWLAYVPGGAASIPQKVGGGRNVLAFIAMKTAQDELVPWLCSQTDLLSGDWELVDAPQPGHTSAPA